MAKADAQPSGIVDLKVGQGVNLPLFSFFLSTKSVQGMTMDEKMEVSVGLINDYSKSGDGMGSAVLGWGWDGYHFEYRVPLQFGAVYQNCR